MHDIDHIRLESQIGNRQFAALPFEEEAFEFSESEMPFQGETGEVFGETEQMELASGLLEVASEAQLDNWLRGLINRAGQAAGIFISSPQVTAIGCVLKGAAKQVLPAIGSAAGGNLGGTSGAKFGGNAASAIGQAFGLETEGLSGEDRDFEIARRYVNFAGEAVKNLGMPTGPDSLKVAKLGNAPGTANIGNAAMAAAKAAAKTHASGLLRTRQTEWDAQADSSVLPVQSGRWMRRGNKIILYGI